MYLNDSDLYVNNNPHIENDRDAYLYLQGAFPSLFINDEQGSYRSAILCLLIYIGYCASPPELSYFFGSFFQSASAYTRYHELHIDKHGVISPLSWAKPDMNARVAYFLTKKGYDSYLSSVVDTLKPARGAIKIRRSKGVVPLHDYGVGLSLYSFILMRQPFYFEKEETFSSSFVKQKGGVCVDCTVYVPSGEEPYRVYVEQDMGTEPIATLVAKISTYERCGLTRYPSCIVISSHLCIPYSSADVFKPALVKKLIEAVKEFDATGLFDLYAHFIEELTDKEADLLCQMLVLTGVCTASDDETAFEQINRYTKLRRNVDRFGAVIDFSADELLRYHNELQGGCNPYRLRLYNKEQAAVTKTKLHNMCSTIAYSLLKKTGYSPDVQCLLNGYNVYVLPSVLLSKSASLLLPGRAFWEQCQNALEPYYGGIRSASLESKYIDLEEYYSVRFRNTCSLSDGTLVVMEHIGKDVGGFIRLLHLCRTAAALQDKIHAVAVFDELDDMYFFSRLSGYYIDYPIFDRNASFFVSFLLEEELCLPEVNLRGVDDVNSPIPFLLRH